MDIKKSGGTIGLMDLLGLSRKTASRLKDESAYTFAEHFLKCLRGAPVDVGSGGGIAASSDSSDDATSFMERDASGWAGFSDKTASRVDLSEKIDAEEGKIQVNSKGLDAEKSSRPRFNRWTDAGNAWDVFGAGLAVWKDPDYEREYREYITKNAAPESMAPLAE